MRAKGVRENVPDTAPSNQISIQKENLRRQREEKSHNLRPSSDFHGKIMLRLVFLSLRSTLFLKTSFPFHGSDFWGQNMGSLILSRSSICLGKKNLGFFNSISNRKIMPCNWYLTCTFYYLLIFAIQLAIMDCGYDLLSFFELWNWISPFPKTTDHTYSR